MLTAFGSIDSAIAAIRLGAVDYLTKPVDLNRRRAVVVHALDAPEAPPAPSSRAAAPAVTTGTTSAAPVLLRPILGTSAAAERLRGLIGRVAATDATVLVLGESGTGKELVARALHEQSARRAGPFIALNVAALLRELVESTLFGHAKGAFTGADQLQRGCCEVADKGTLFLDEIGEMEVNLQAKLLRFLQAGAHLSAHRAKHADRRRRADRRRHQPRPARAGAQGPAPRRPVLPPQPRADRPAAAARAARIEREAIAQALAAARGNVREAAKTLGLGQATVYRKIKKYNLPVR